MNDSTQPPDIVISAEAAQQQSGEARFSTPNANTNPTQMAENAKAVTKRRPIEEHVLSVSEPDIPPSIAHSKQPPFALRWFSYLFVIPLIGLATGFYGSLSLLCGLWDKSGHQQHLIARLWARTLLLISLSPVKIIGTEKLHLHDTAVYASNHTSYMDTPVLFARLPFQFRILAKQSLWKIPFIGWYLNHSGQVPVDTNSPRTLIASLNRGVATLKQGIPLVLFPEGGRTPTGHLQSMMSGCAYMAIKAQVPLIPLTLVGTYELLPIHVYAVYPRPLKIIVGDPISTTGLTTRDADALTQRLYQSISATYMQYHPDNSSN
jgi:1-acyl-sn-glycerol-3-phosphate acyltransferase